MISLILFDLDGTLIDSKIDIRNSLNHSLQKEGFQTLPGDVIDNFVGRGLIHLIRDAIGNPSQEQLRKVSQNFWDHYLEHLLDETNLYPGVDEILNKFSDIPKGVVTNKPYAFSEKILKGLKIDHHFRWLVGGDTLKVQKPSPLVFDPIFKDFQEKPKALIVGDSEIDIECGKAAGIVTCAVSYGFRNRKDLEIAKPDYLIERFEELESLDCFKRK